MAVVRDVLDRLGLEVAPQPVGVGAFEHQVHQRRTDPLALPIGMRAQQLQIPVHLVRRVFLHQRTDDRETLQPVGRRFGGRRVDREVDLGPTRRDPHRHADAVVGAPHLAEADPATHRRPHHLPTGSEEHLVLGIEPTNHRIVGKGANRRDTQR